jgi:hypothetical protein
MEWKVRIASLTHDYGRRWLRGCNCLLPLTPTPPYPLHRADTAEPLPLTRQVSCVVSLLVFVSWLRRVRGLSGCRASLRKWRVLWEAA